MTKAEAEKKVQKLKEDLDRHNYRYYVEARPTISDSEYDKLMRDLIELERKFPDLCTSDSPSQRRCCGGVALRETHAI